MLNEACALKRRCANALPALIIFSLISSSAAVQAHQWGRGGYDEARGGYDRDSGRWGRDGRMDRYDDQLESFQADRGYLFVDGEFIAPPYDAKLIDGSVEVNGRTINPDQFDLARPDDDRGETTGFAATRRWPAGRRWRGDTSTPDVQLLKRLETLTLGDVVVLKTGAAPLVLDMAREGELLLAGLCETTPTHPQVVPDSIRSESDREIWLDLIGRFEPSPLFLERANADLAELKLTDEHVDQVLAASLWSDAIAFPLSLAAMILVVYAFGHLLSHKPSHESVNANEDDYEMVRRVVGRSLAIVALLSIVDLVWTVTASQQGAMRELNPIGNHFIDDPIKLLAFKFGVVSVAIGLIYALHRHPIAQQASWWSCLVLTLVTARWLTFHAMFL